MSKDDEANRKRNDFSPRQFTGSLHRAFASHVHCPQFASTAVTVTIHTKRADHVDVFDIFKTMYQLLNAKTVKKIYYNVDYQQLRHIRSIFFVHLAIEKMIDILVPSTVVVVVQLVCGISYKR